MTEKINYITGAVTGLENKGELTEVTMYDGIGTFFCKKALGMKVGCAYKFGIVDTPEDKRYEIVSIEQQLIKEPAFQPKVPEQPNGASQPAGPQQQMVQMSLADYKELLNAKNIKIRSESIKAALEICGLTVKKKSSPENYKRTVLNVAKDLEQYFE